MSDALNTHTHTHTHTHTTIPSDIFDITSLLHIFFNLFIETFLERAVVLIEVCTSAPFGLPQSHSVSTLHWKCLCQSRIFRASNQMAVSLFLYLSVGFHIFHHSLFPEILWVHKTTNAHFLPAFLPILSQSPLLTPCPLLDFYVLDLVMQSTLFSNFTFSLGICPFPGFCIHLYCEDSLLYVFMCACVCVEVSNSLWDHVL